MEILVTVSVYANANKEELLRRFTYTSENLTDATADLLPNVIREMQKSQSQAKDTQNEVPQDSNTEVNNSKIRGSIYLKAVITENKRELANNEGYFNIGSY